MGTSQLGSTDTAALLEVSAQDAKASFDRLFSGFRPYLGQVISLRMDSRLRGRLDASDVLQDTQLEAFRRFGEYMRKRHVPFRIWLLQIAHNRIREARRRHLKTASRRAGREVCLPEDSAIQLAAVAGSCNPGERAARRERALLVRSALAQMSEADREVLLMRSVERLAYDAIGYILKIDPAAARKRHGRALIRLGNLLRELGLRESQL